MKHLILDGYNVIHKIPRLGLLASKSLRESREALCFFINEWKRDARYKGRVTIVFDGQDDAAPGFENAAIYGINIIYSKGSIDADKKIISMIKNSSKPSDITVISDDNYVRNNSKAHGANVNGVKFLIDGAPSKEAGPDKAIDPKAESEINEYLKKIWKI